jgi:hypothetical protein
MRYLFTLIILLHGIIHIMGFLKAFNLAEINQIQTVISHPMGIIWLVAAILFLLAAFLNFITRYWFIPATAASIMSSFLIISTWSDARFGMIPNVIILITCIFAFISCNYKSLYLKDIKTAKIQNQNAVTSILSKRDIDMLPIPVQQYLRYAGCIGKPKVFNFKASFRGKIRSKEKQVWMNFNCEQHNFLASTSRLFFMDARMKGLPVAGYHHFKNGEAVMDIRLLSFIKVQYAKGKEMDVSETVTFLNDMCFMAPAMLIDKRINWSESDKRTAKCSFSNNGISISATLFFNDQGELVNFVSNDRYAYNSDGTMTRLQWQTPVKEYRTLHGFHLPSYAEMIYNYPDGEFCYGEFQLKDIEYNL